MVSVQPAPLVARDRDRGDRVEDRNDGREDKKDKDKKDKHYKKDHRDDEREHRVEARDRYWDAARYYKRDDHRYKARRLGRNDWVYRGSDNRYYCRRDDGTTGLIIGGISGAVLGHIIAPGGAKTLGTIVGAGAGALIGRAIDEGDVVCR